MPVFKMLAYLKVVGFPTSNWVDKVSLLVKKYLKGKASAYFNPIALQEAKTSFGRLESKRVNQRVNFFLEKHFSNIQNV